jgi:hypothetical protein
LQPYLSFLAVFDDTVCNQQYGDINGAVAFLLNPQAATPAQRAAMAIAGVSNSPAKNGNEGGFDSLSYVGRSLFVDSCSEFCDEI